MQSYALYDELLSYPHILVAGATGSGKSVVLRGLTYSALAHGSELVALDLKRVELSDLRPSRRLIGYASEPAEVCRLLDAVLRLMEDRYRLMQKQGKQQYGGVQCWVLVDELADVLAECGKPALERLARLARLGRAARVGLIACTQSPARSTLPARLVQNLPARVALRCCDPIESRQVIGVRGAEFLPLYGSALIRLPARELFRVSGIPLISSEMLSARIAESNRLTL